MFYIYYFTNYFDGQNTFTKVTIFHFNWKSFVDSNVKYCIIVSIDRFIFHFNWIKKKLKLV